MHMIKVKEKYDKSIKMRYFVDINKLNEIGLLNQNSKMYGLFKIITIQSIENTV